jgi:hypothetical protein
VCKPLEGTSFCTWTRNVTIQSGPAAEVNILSFTYYKITTWQNLLHHSTLRFANTCTSFCRIYLFWLPQNSICHFCQSLFDVPSLKHWRTIYYRLQEIWSALQHYQRFLSGFTTRRGQFQIKIRRLHNGVVAYFRAASWHRNGRLGKAITDTEAPILLYH